MKKRLLLLSSLIIVLSSCTIGPDWSPDVTSHAASFGGPIMTPNATYGNNYGAVYGAPAVTRNDRHNIFE